MDPNLGQYITSARAHGMSDAEIKSQLLTAGWDEAMVTQALGSVGTAPAAAPAPAPASAMTASPATATHKSPLVVIFIASVVLLAALGFLGYRFYAARTRPVNSTVTVTSPTATATVVPTKSFNSDYLSFKYDATWQPKKTTELLENPNSTEDQTFFFTAEGLAAVQKDIADFKAKPNAGLVEFINLILSFGNNAQFAVTTVSTPTPAPTSALPGVTILDTTPKQTAKDHALEATKTTCTGDESSSDSNAPTDPSRVLEETVAGQTVYTVASQPACNSKGYSVYADTASGAIVLLSFPHVRDQASMTSSQKIILNSLKFK